jgi:integrase
LVLFNTGGREKSDETRAEYERNWRLHLGPALGNCKLRDITKHMVDTMVEDLSAKHQSGKGREHLYLGPLTIDKVVKLLRAMLTVAVGWKWLSYPHAASGIALSQETRRDSRPPEAETVDRLLEAAALHATVDGLFFRLAAVTGARRGELAALEWGDFLLKERALSINKAIQERRVNEKGVRRSEQVLGKTKTLKSVRALALDEKTLALFMKHRDEVAELQKSAGLAWNERAAVFAADPAGQVRIAKNAWSKRWVRLQGREGITGIRLHDLRHFVGYTLGESRPITEVSLQLGHSRVTTTSIYMGVKPSNKAVELIVAALEERVA